MLVIGERGQNRLYYEEDRLFKGLKLRIKREKHIEWVSLVRVKTNSVILYKSDKSIF